MEKAESIIDRKLHAVRQEIAEAEQALQDYDDQQEAKRREEDAYEKAHGPSFHADTSLLDWAERAELTRKIEQLQIQMRTVEEIKALIQQQHMETRAQFSTIEKRDHVSARQNIWLSIATSTATLIIGWLLSLVATPATILHVIGF